MTLSRNEPCWCGSGRKYKKCHLDRDRQTPPTYQEVQQAIRRSHNEKTCLHPDAPRGCGAAIRAHTIQRSGVLDRIERDGHVYTLSATTGPPPDYKLTVKDELIGIKGASTFRGFCGHHDNELFSPIEKQAFEVNKESALLVGYRSLCFGYYQTKAGLRALEYFGLLDKGAAPDVQAKWQSFLRERKEACISSIRIAEAQRASMGDQIRQGNFHGVCYYALEFSAPITIAAAFGWHPTHDFEDRQFLVSEDEPPSDLLFWSAMPTERGGVCIYVWLGEQPASVKFIRSLHRVPDSAVAHAMVLFSNLCENTYFAPEWWDALPKAKKDWMRDRFHATIAPGPIMPRLYPESPWLADWGTVRRVTNLSAMELEGTGCHQ